MSGDIPPEVRSLIADFKQSDPGWQKDFLPKERQVEIPKVGTAQDAINLARSRGYEIQIGGGKHGTHVIDGEGHYICSIPDHGGSGRQLAKGTWRAILNRLELEN